MKIIKINETEYPFLFSVNAIRAYMDHLTKSAKDEETSNSVDEVQKWIELGLKNGCKAEGVTFDLKHDEIADWMDRNFEEVCALGGHCRRQMVIFNKSLTGEVEPVENGQTKKKTAKA